MNKIDIFNHVLPMNYYNELHKVTGRELPLVNVILLKDFDERVREVAGHEGLTQVITLASPEELNVVPASQGTRLAALANDEMARLLSDYPETFTAGIGSVCLNDMDGAVRETRRAIDKLGFRGIQLATTCAGEDLSDKKYLPFFEVMAEYGLPVLLHPCDGVRSQKDFIFNWPLETTWMMINMAVSGIFERLPRIKLVTHHLGALVPTFHNRIYTAYLREGFYDAGGGVDALQAYENLKSFYCDTALYGDCTAAIQAGIDFFGADHILFGTDYPLDGDRSPHGKGQTANTISSIERLKISDGEKQLIFEQNALKLMNMESRPS